MDDLTKHVQEFDPRDGEQAAWVTATKEGALLTQLTLTDFARKTKANKSLGGKVKIEVVGLGEIWAVEVRGMRVQRNETLVYLTDRLLAAGYAWAFTIDDFSWLPKV
jgi:hypothetical protein